MLYWIEYTDGSTRTFEAKDDKEAHHYFMMEGDHAGNYGCVDEPHVVEVDFGGGIAVVDLDDIPGRVKHRTHRGKGVVGQAIAKHKKPPNCS